MAHDQADVAMSDRHNSDLANFHLVEQQYQLLLDHSSDMICIYQNKRLVYVNPALIRSLGGTSEDQFLGRPITEFVHRDSVAAMLARIALIRDTRDATNPAEVTMLRVDGTTLDAESVCMFTMREGKPAYQIILRNLSAQKHVEEAQRYRQLIDHTPHIICVHQNKRLVYVNPALIRSLGGTSEGQFRGRPITEFVHRDSVAAMLARIALLQHVGDSSAPAAVVIFRLDGTTIDMESVSVLTVWEGKPAYQVILRDLSAQKAAKETQRYRQLIDHCPDAICVHESGRITYINPAGVRWMAATSESQIIGRLITEFVHPDSVAPMLARITSLRNIGDSSSPSEAVMLRLDGTKLPVEAISVLTMWEEKPAYQVTFRDLTAQKAAEEILRHQAALVDHVSDAVIATTFDGIVTSWNPAAEKIYGRSAAQALALPVSEAVGAPLDLRAVVSGGGVMHTTHRTLHGAALIVRVSVAAMDNGFVLVCCDQTALRRAEQHFQTVVASLEEGIVAVSNDGRIESVNPAALRTLGIDQPNDVDEYITCAETFPHCRSHENATDCGQRSLCEFFQIREPQTGHIFRFDRPVDGQQRWLSVNCKPLNLDDSHDSAALFSIVDVTTQYTAREQLAHAAAHDALTGLPNRAQIGAYIDQRLHSADENSLKAVLFIDLDNFKPINDTHGHDAGDQVLQAAARHLRAALRSSDIVGRLGGDEFVALVIGKISRTELDKLSERIHTALAEPTRVANAMLPLRASVGIVVVEDDDHRDRAQILRDADTAMYQAKSSGGGTSYYYTKA